MRNVAGSISVDTPAEGVARVTIDNAAKRNALDRPILEGLASTLPELDARCIIVTGAGTVFSAGYDIGDLSAERLAEEAAELLTHPFEAALAAMDAVEVPVVAAMGGHAFGGGLELALACDLRVCAAGAKLGMPPGRLGVVYSHTGLRRFVDAIGAARTRELFLTARPITADTALAWGLVNEVVEDVADHAVALAAEIAVALAAVACAATSACCARSIRRSTTRSSPSCTRCATPRSARRTSPRASAPSPRSAQPRWRGV